MRVFTREIRLWAASVLVGWIIKILPKDGSAVDYFTWLSKMPVSDGPKRFVFTPTTPDGGSSTDFKDIWDNKLTRSIHCDVSAYDGFKINPGNEHKEETPQRG
jgi:hypothetical protein